jgi:hypothetical protein
LIGFAGGRSPTDAPLRHESTLVKNSCLSLQVKHRARTSATPRRDGVARAEAFRRGEVGRVGDVAHG